LTDADVDLEWHVDGRRNWWLRDPEYRGPPKYRILRLEARRSRIRYANANIALDLTATSTPESAAASGAATASPLTNHIVFAGTFAGRAFSADVLTSDTLTLQGTGEFFELRGHASAGGPDLDMDGRLADFLRLGAIDAQARFSGPSLAQLHPFLHSRWPSSHAYHAEGRLKVTQSEYAFEDFHGTLGATDVAGSASFSRNAARRSVRATLRSELAHLADLTTLRYPDAAGDAQPPADTVSAQGKAALRTDAPDRVFSAAPLHADRLKAYDAHVTVQIAKFQAPGLQLLDSMNATVDLQGGILKIEPFDLGLAGGHATGTITLDGTQEPASADLSLSLRQLHLAELAPKLPATKFSAGPITVQSRLSGRGDSIAALLGNASGTVTASMAGGRISNLLDSELALNGGKVLWLKLRGDREIAVNCAIVGLDFRDGVGKARSFVLDTEQTRINGAGTLNLREENFNLLLTPEAKEARVFALGSALDAHGSFMHPGYTIAKGTPPRAGAGKPAVPGQC